MAGVARGVARIAAISAAVMRFFVLVIYIFLYIGEAVFEVV